VKAKPNFCEENWRVEYDDDETSIVADIGNYSQPITIAYIEWQDEHDLARAALMAAAAEMKEALLKCVAALRLVTANGYVHRGQPTDALNAGINALDKALVADETITNKEG